MKITLYPLPNKSHDVVDDINDLRNTFVLMDADMQKIENEIANRNKTVTDLKNSTVHSSFVLKNPEIQKIAPNRYIVVNSSGDGLECLDGGGDAGGKIAQAFIKKSDADFDTTWGNVPDVSKNGMKVQENSETSKSNEVHILVDEAEIENDKQLPKIELTNLRSDSNFVAENNEAVILRDEFEEDSEEIQVATNENFGVVKLGENLSINSAGEMEIDEMESNATIYNLGNVKVCYNGNIDLEEQTLQYRIFVTEDLVVQFRIDFEPQDDFSFVLEIVSDGRHLIAFNENLNPQITTLPINRGTTKINVTKKMGVPHYDIEISRLDAPEPTLLTPNYGDDINSNLMVTHNVANWNAHDMLNSDTSNTMSFWGGEVFFEFSTLVVVDYVFCHFRYTNKALGMFWLKASSDKKNRTTLLYKSNEVADGKTPTEIKGCFRYFKLFVGRNDDNNPKGFQLWGTQIDNNESELVLLTPKMASNETGFAKLTYSNLYENGASQLTDTEANTYIHVKYSEDTTDLFRWIKYEFPEPLVANFLDVAAFKENLNRTMRWYKLEGSNDDEAWILLLERQYQRDFTGDETRWHEFENTTAYKYYKLTCKSTNGDDCWCISRFRLFRRELGKHNFYRGVPLLFDASQDGYEVIASSQSDNGHAAKYAFDDNNETCWCSHNENNSWLQIKLPIAMAFDAVKIASRFEQAPKNFEIQGSNDGETWNTLSTQIDISWLQDEYKTFRFENETAYLYYRLYINANNGNSNTRIGELVLGNFMYEYKRWLDKYDNVVPTMTSDETTAEDGVYKLSSSTEHLEHKRIYLFDKKFDTRFELDGETSGWIQVELPIRTYFV